MQITQLAKIFLLEKKKMHFYFLKYLVGAWSCLQKFYAFGTNKIIYYIKWIRKLEREAIILKQSLNFRLLSTKFI